MDHAKLKRHYWVRSLILTGFALLLAHLIVTERLSHYLAPRLHMFTYVTLGILVILTAVSVRQAFAGSTDYDCDCEDAHKIPRSPWISLVVYGLFVLPLAVGFLMPDKILGSAVAEKRGITLLSNDVKKLAQVTVSTDSEQLGPESAKEPAKQENQQDTGKEAQSSAKATANTTPSGNQVAKQSVPMNDAQIRKLFGANDFGDFYTDTAVSLYKQPVINLNDKVFLDGLTTMELYAKQFAGKELETLGFVYREPGFTPQQFVVARFSVSCCTADASVFGVLVENNQASKWAKDSWVKVRGKIELRTVDGYDMLVLKATQVESVKAPKDPYVYYNYDTPVSN